MQLNKLVRKIIEKERDSIHTAMPARIISYDSEKLRAKIVLLFRDSNGSERPPILQVPVTAFFAGGFIIRPSYVSGDVVQVLFSEQALDNMLQSNNSREADYKRHHSIDDAVIIGGLMIDGTNLPSDKKSGVYIGDIGGKNYIHIDDNVDVDTEGDVNIKATGKIHVGNTTPLSGVVQGECIDSFTGAPYADKSSKVFAEK